MINFAEKSLMALEELKTIDQSSISSFSYLLMQDGLASTMAHIGEQLDSNKLSAEVQKNLMKYHGLQFVATEIDTIIGIKTFLTTQLQQSLKKTYLCC